MSHPRVVQPAHLFTAFAALALGCGGDGNASDTTDADVVDAADGAGPDGAPLDAAGSRIDRILALMARPDGVERADEFTLVRREARLEKHHVEGHVRRGYQSPRGGDAPPDMVRA